LEDAGGKIDGVGLGIFVGIDGRRRHFPFGAVKRGANFVDPALELEACGVLTIEE
jgi:hypothetical protein